MNWTLIFIITLVVAVAVYDVFIICKKGKYHSISAYLIRASKRHPSIPFLIGFTCGHLFWSMDTKDIWTDNNDKVIEGGMDANSQVLDPISN